MQKNETRYSKSGKRTSLISQKVFVETVRANNLKVEYISFLAMLYYFGLRVSEVLGLPKNPKEIGLTANLFSIDKSRGLLIVDVPKRLKHGMKTPPISLSLRRPFIKEIIMTVQKAIDKNGKDAKVWNFTRQTGWNITNKVFGCYPHWFRLNRISKLFLPNPHRPSGLSIGEVKGFTGLTLKALDYYLTLVRNAQIGEMIE